MRFPVIVGLQLLLTALVIALVLTLSESSPGIQAAPAVEWDARLDKLRVTLAPAADCSGGCWRLRSARYEDQNEAGGLHHIWARAMDANGSFLEGKPWTVAWPGGSQALSTKPPSEWSDHAMWDCYAVYQGETGAYSAYMGDDPARSDTVRGMGLPYCLHVNFRLVWQWTDPTAPPPASPTPWAYITATLPPSNGAHRLGFPMVLAQRFGFPPGPSATATLPSAPTATPTVTPRPNSAPFSGVVVQTFVNCGLTQLIGVVHDANGAPLPGTQIRLTWDGQVGPPLFARAGDYVRPETDASGWDFVLAQGRVANQWRVAVVDAAGNPLSEELRVRTDDHCEPNAVNVAKVRFLRQP